MTGKSRYIRNCSHSHLNAKRCHVLMEHIVRFDGLSTTVTCMQQNYTRPTLCVCDPDVYDPVNQRIYVY